MTQRESEQRYSRSPKGKARTARYNAKPAVQDRIRTWQAEHPDRMHAYEQRPHRKQYKLEWQRRRRALKRGEGGPQG